MRAGIGDDCGAAFGFEIFLEDQELAGGRHPIPIHDCDLRRRLVTAPFAVSAEQRSEQKSLRLRQPAIVFLEKVLHRRHLEKNFLELHLIANARGILGVVFEKVKTESLR